MTKLNDIITLARAGYKAGEIAQLLTEASRTDEGTETPTEIPERDRAQPETAKVTEQPSEQPEAEAEDKILQLQQQIDDLTKKLSEAQAANTRQDNSGYKPEDPQETLNKIMEKFM